MTQIMYPGIDSKSTTNDFNKSLHKRGSTIINGSLPIDQCYKGPFGAGMTT